jgi:hypothetical protein
LSTADAGEPAEEADLTRQLSRGVAPLRIGIGRARQDGRRDLVGRIALRHGLAHRDGHAGARVEGQDGNLLWGKTWISDGPKDPFAWAIAPDGKTIVGSDSDGSHFLTLLSADRMERCYTHDGTSPSQSIVATCGVIERVRH